MNFRYSLAFAACMTGLVLVVACGDDDSASGGSSGTGSNAGAFKQCSAGVVGNTCTDAENTTYSNCIVNACDSTFKQCYGASYKSGDFSGGACGTYIACTQKCACNDTNCSQACGTPEKACLDCLGTFSTCSSQCTLPACASQSASSSSSSSSSGAPATGDHTCADVTTCCGKMSEGQLKTSCNTAVQQANGDASSCNVLYNNFSPYCP